MVGRDNTGGVPKLEDEIVISGISGRFPECDNIEEFKEKLLEGVDMITADETRWPSKLYGLPARMGKLKNLDHFDAEFFGTHAKQADVMDPQLRILLEVTYEAIVDAGYNPSELKNSKVGVFIGACESDTGAYWRHSSERVSAYVATGNARTMLSNKISYFFDFKGPSYSIDAACSSSLVAVQKGFAAIKSGECDSAIVGGTNVCLQPTGSLQFKLLNLLNEEGMCKSFDNSGKGYVRSEAVCAIFLQKVHNSRRVYATILGAKVNSDGYTKQGITFPSGKLQKELIEEVYNESGINPKTVAFVEAHGTGTPAGDPEEVNAIAEVFCKDRSEPLPIGSVKSNMGHSEPASGICSLAKVIIAMETGIIPKNIHFSSPNTQIPALNDGRIKVVVQNKPWNGGLVGVNSFGFGGTNVHVLLRSNSKTKIKNSSEPIPRLVTASGRTQSSVSKILNKVEEHKGDYELMALLNDVHAQNIIGHGFRGYRLLGNALSQEITSVNLEKRPIWYVYSGMGSQWPHMAKDLMAFEVFRNSIKKSADVLRVYGLNLEDIVLKYDKTEFGNLLCAFVSINAVQIALTDVLTSLGIKPDGIVGHSAGELGCAYADGCLTYKQSIMAAYARGSAIFHSNVQKGAMASIGLSFEKCIQCCPAEIVVACHNSKDNVTVSGPVKPINEFVTKLESQGIFAKVIDSSGLAFHSKYIANARPFLKKAFDEIIPEPKPRSSKWISSSVPESDWNSPIASFCSSDYHVGNVISPVLFHEATRHIPKNAITIEIAPHGLLQAILRRTLGADSTNVSLLNKDAPDNTVFFLSAIGKIFNSGAQPKVSNLYSQVEYPVGRGTAMINSMIEWDHSKKWTVANFCANDSKSGECHFKFDLENASDRFLAGHMINERVLFPGSGYLILAWKTLAQIKNKNYKEMAVIFENVEFTRATILPKTGAVKFLVNILEGSGVFEICESGSIVARGKISIPRNVSKEFVRLADTPSRLSPNVLQLTKNDIYKEFKLRGYEYDGLFKGLLCSDVDFVNGKIKSERNWIVYVDQVLQFFHLGIKSRDLYLPMQIRRVVVDPTLHCEYISTSDSISIKYCPNTDIVQSGGLEMHGIKVNLAPLRETFTPPKLELYKFVPYNNITKRQPAITVLIQIVLENSDSFKLKAIEILQDDGKEYLLSLPIKSIIESEIKASVDYSIIKFQESDLSEWENNQIHIVPKSKMNQFKANVHLAVTRNVLSSRNWDLIKNVIDTLKPGGFILSEEQDTFGEINVIESLGLTIIANQNVGTTSFVLLRKPLKVSNNSVVIYVTRKNFKWLEPLKTALKRSETDGTKIYLVSENEEFYGLMGMVNCLKREPGGEKVRAYYVPNKENEVFSLSATLYSKQIAKDLIHNVLHSNTWGSYRHLLLDECKSVTTPNAYINIMTKGDLSSLRWIEGPLLFQKSGDMCELCTVYYAPINFRDVMLATGQLASDAIPGKFSTQGCLLGLEFSGRDSKGKRVMGVAKSRGLALACFAHPQLLWDVPEDWTLEQAATVPVVYGTVYYALIIRGQLQPGESILIHSGAGGVGQAAITVALSMGCVVFTTVGSQSKRSFLKKTFPQLDDSHIGNSRDASFERLIKYQTEGRGVDVVLNSLSETLLQASVRCLANRGRFLEIGKVDLFNNSSLGMNIFLKNISFHGILFDDIIEKDNPCNSYIVKLVNEGIVSGAVRPLPSAVFAENQVEQAFRFMASGNHIGKVILKLQTEESQRIAVPSLKLIDAVPRTYMNSSKSYVMVGGLGGIGLEVTNWLISRGANKIVLNSRKGITTGYQSLCLRRWRKIGANVQISTHDASTEVGARALIEEALQLGVVGGIFNLAAVLKDAAVENLSDNDFYSVALPKVHVTKNLDVVSRKLAPHLDYFVVFSSIACGRGNFGQSNYAYANSVMERICESRQANNLPGLAIQWGTIGDVGLAVEKVDVISEKVIGARPQPLRSCLSAMDIFLKQPHAIVSSMILTTPESDSTHTTAADDVAKIMGIKDINTVLPVGTLSDLGIDSLMVSEVKQTLERNYDSSFTIQQIRELTFNHLSLLGK